MVNQYLVRDLKALNLWDEVMVGDIKYFDGSLCQDRPHPGRTARTSTPPPSRWTPTWLIEAGARRQKWIDQAQSLNLYFHGASGKKLDETYKLAWMRGLKTTYYLRSMGATARREIHRQGRRTQRRVQRWQRRDGWRNGRFRNGDLRQRRLRRLRRLAGPAGTGNRRQGLHPAPRRPGLRGMRGLPVTQPAPRTMSSMTPLSLASEVVYALFPARHGAACLHPDGCAHGQRQ